MTRTQIGTGIAAVAALVAASVLMSVVPASAHGYVDDTGNGLESRASLDANANEVGSVRYEPQSLEAPKGWPSASGSPADGKIASAGGLFGGTLDQQTSSKWHKQKIKSGVNTIDWKFTAAHKTAKWEYWITKSGWDPNAKLTRSSFESKPFAVIQHDGSAASGNPSHTVNVPDHKGYQVILGIWEIADTAMSFYNVIDVDIEGTGAPDTQPPTAPSDVRASNVGATSVTLQWTKSTDNTGVDGYEISQNGTRVGTTTNTSYTANNLQPDTSYQFVVSAYDAAGNTTPSAPVTVKTTPPTPDTQPPSAPTGLQATAVGPSHVDLSWMPSTDNVALSQYVVTRQQGSSPAQNVGTVPAGTQTFQDTGLTPDTGYTYTVVAFDTAGNSTASSPLAVKTAQPGQAGGDLPTWSPTGKYEKGDKVKWEGVAYECVQGYQGVGDPGWIHALSLWNPLT